MVALRSWRYQGHWSPRQRFRGTSRLRWISIDGSVELSVGGVGSLRFVTAVDVPRSLLFLGKVDDPHCERALEWCRSQPLDVQAHLGGWGEPLPAEARGWEGDLIVSYLSRWVVPQHLLAVARVAAINFHPASPDYPGIGCNNFALYDGAAEYGVTCHHMAATVDTGPIIAVRRFPVTEDDDVASLLTRTYEVQFELFIEVMEALVAGRGLPSSAETWTRSPYTRAEFDQLGKISPDMDADEIARRIRATSFGPWQPTVELAGHTFVYRPT